jgi:hypothetical protein
MATVETYRTFLLVRVFCVVVTVVGLIRTIKREEQ